MNEIFIILDQLLNLVFLLVMGVLYALSMLFGVSYKLINIYAYFCAFPISLLFFLKSNLKYLFIVPLSIISIAILTESYSIYLFDSCVIFLNWAAAFINSNYMHVSVYICVFIPLFIYSTLLWLRYNIKIPLYLNIILILITIFTYYFLITTTNELFIPVTNFIL